MRRLPLRSVSILALLSALGPTASGGPSFPMSIPPVRFDGERVVTAHVTTKAQLDALLALTDDVWSHHLELGPIDVRLDARGVARLDELGIPYEVTIADLQGAVEAEAARIAANRAKGGAGRGLAWFQEYKTYDEIVAYLNGLAGAHPGLAQTFIAGQTLQGRPIVGIRITGPGPVGGRQAVLFNGCQHAREWVSPMTVTYLADQLLEEYDSNPQVRALVDSLEFVIVPIVNADGYVYTWSTNRLWRKNRRNNGDGSFGVDLNRNWGHQWGGEGASANPANDTYRGPSAFSEPETQVMRDLVIANPRLEASIDFHSYSQLILHPWGYTSNLPPDNAEFTTISEGMAESIFAVHGKNYVFGPSYTTIYPASGTMPDWTYGAQGMLGWTIELRDTGASGFLLPPDQIIPTGQENFAAAISLADYLAQPVRFAFPLGQPTVLPPNEASAVRVEITSGSATFDPSSGRLLARVGTSGSFAESVLMSLGGGLFEGTLPGAPCESAVQYYFQGVTTGGQTVRFPLAGSEAPFEATALSVAVTMDDPAEVNTGWTVGAPGDTAIRGLWELANPQPTSAQPGDDHTPAGVNCWITDGRGGNPGDFDVDGGATTLTSPRFSALDPTLGGAEAFVSYHRWYSNDQGATPGTDSMPVLISNDDGATWAQLELVVENANAWVFKSFRVADVVTPSADMRLRFVARDLDPGSLVEAGVDDVRVVVTGCAGSPADFNGDGVVNIADFLAFLAAYSAGDARADFNRDGSINVGDFLAFLEAYSLG